MGSAITHHHYSGDLYANCLLLEFIRSFNTQKVFSGLEVAIAGWQMHLLTW